MTFITAAIAFLSTYWVPLIAPALFLALSAVVAIWPNSGGTVGALRAILERFSGLQPAASQGTLKVPGAKPGPRVAPVMEE